MFPRLYVGKHQKVGYIGAVPQVAVKPFDKPPKIHLCRANVGGGGFPIRVEVARFSPVRDTQYQIR
jgi:hypothetical protein